MRKFFPVYESFSILVIIIFVIIGSFVYDDFGVAWDEETQIYDTGKGTTEFIENRDAEKFLKNPEKYHGPAFEIVLEFLQNKFKLHELEDILPFRHLVTYLFYCLSGFFMFLILKDRFPKSIFILIGVSWYFIMPRIFADAFFNSKDIPFLALTTICLWSFNSLLRRVTPGMCFIHGMLCGFLISIRIIGLIIPVISISILIFQFILNSYFLNNKEFKFPFLGCLIMVVSTFTFMVLSWPVLWLGPIEHLGNAWGEMSKFHWNSTVLYFGELISSNSIPWHYNFIWIGITTPPFYLLVFMVSLGFIFRIIYSFEFEKFNHYLFELSCAVVYCTPIIMIIVFDSVVYDSWRHIFFIFSPFVILCIFGLSELNKLFQNKTGIRIGIVIAVILFTSGTAFQMIKLHPYQNVYFNILAGVDNDKNRFKFELDYWGLSYREALTKLAEKATDEPIKVHVPNWPGYSNINLLKPELRSNLIYAKMEEADYHVTNHRWEVVENVELIKVDSVSVNGITINSTYKLSNN